MLKKILCLVTICMTSFLAFAYNPPAYGENIYNFVSPESLALSDSVTGGALYSVDIENISVNPALIASEQRVTLKVSGSMLFQNKYEAEEYNVSEQKGGAAQFGMLFPSRAGVAAVDLQFVGMPEGLINYGKNFTVRSAFAKDLIDELYVGVGLYGSFGDDWAFAGDLGLWCNIKKVSWLPFMDDCRWAVSFTGLGKSYKSPATGIYGEPSTGIPSPFTMRMGFAGTFVKLKNFTGGIAFDLAFPSFQNIVFATGIDLVFINMISLRTGWEINLRDLIATKNVMIPSVALSVKFNFTASKKDDSFIAKKGWSQSEMNVSTGYRYFKTGIHAVAAGVTVRTGQKDTVAPVIKLWEDK